MCRVLLVGFLCLLCAPAFAQQCTDRDGDGRCDWTPVRNVVQAMRIAAELSDAIPNNECGCVDCQCVNCECGLQPTLAPELPVVHSHTLQPVRSVLEHVAHAQPVRSTLRRIAQARPLQRVVQAQPVRRIVSFPVRLLRRCR